jgi:hypothetical protein
MSRGSGVDFLFEWRVLFFYAGLWLAALMIYDWWSRDDND